jgi:hypothetical protein
VPVLRHPLGDAVAHERGGRGAGGRDSHPAPDHARAQRSHPVARQLGPGLQHDLGIDAGGAAFEAQALLHGEQDLADAEQADDGDEEIEAVQQLGKSERQAQLPGDVVEPDGSKGESDHHRRDGLERRLFAHADEAAEGEEVDGEFFRRPELQREPCHQRRHQGDDDDGEQGADEGRREGSRQRFAGAAVLRHGMAVEGGRHRPGLARNVEQDRRDGAAEQCAPVDARQHDDGRRRRHGKRQRQQDGDAVGPAEAGQHANDHPEQDADHHQQHVEGLDDDGKPVEQIGDFFH